jgi:pSer/pThr/pTyr-binding forkhead associated (FHA) protein
VDDPLASRLHCAIEIGEDGVVLRDLGSTNGTLVNNQPIMTATLAGGSTFRVGSYIFQLLITPKRA